MTPPIRLTLVTLGVSDVARSTRFYETLGLTRSPASPEGSAFFAAGGVMLSIRMREPAGTEDAVADDANQLHGRSLSWNVRSEGEVDKAIVRMVAAGGGLVKVGAKTSAGSYAGLATDPDGHLWEVAFDPGVPLDENGRLRLPE